MDQITNLILCENNFNFLKEKILTHYNISANSLNKTMYIVENSLKEFTNNYKQEFENNEQILKYIGQANEQCIDAYEKFLLNKFKGKNIYKNIQTNSESPKKSDIPKMKILDEEQKNMLLSKMFKEVHPEDKLLSTMTDPRFLEKFAEHLDIIQNNVFEKNIELYLKAEKKKIKKIITTQELNRILSKYSKDKKQSANNEEQINYNYETKLLQIQNEIEEHNKSGNVEGLSNAKIKMNELIREIENEHTKLDEKSKIAEKNINTLKKIEPNITEEKMDDNNYLVNMSVDTENIELLRNLELKLLKDRKVKTIKLIKYNLSENRNNITRFNNNVSVYQSEVGTISLNIDPGRYNNIDDILDLLNEHQLIEASFYNDKFIIKSKNNKEFTLMFSKNTILDSLGFDSKQNSGKISYQATSPCCIPLQKNYTAILEINSSSEIVHLTKMNEEINLDSNNIMKKSAKGLKMEKIIFRIIAEETKKCYDFINSIQLSIMVEYVDVNN